MEQNLVHLLNKIFNFNHIYLNYHSLYVWYKKRVLIVYIFFFQAEDSNEALEGIENLTVAISQLNQQAAELSNIFNAKSTDEAQLPTASEALKDTNTCIVSALSSLSQGTSILSHHLSDNLPKIGLLLTSEFTEEEPEIEEKSQNSNSQRPISGEDANSPDEDTTSQCKVFRKCLFFQFLYQIFILLV